MRLLALALFALLLLADPALAAQKPPHIKPNTPYPDARRELIRQGFDPVRVVYWADVVSGKCEDAADADICRRYPEVLNCAGAGGGWSPCEFLFRGRADGRYWMVYTDGEPDSASEKEMRRLRCCGFAPALKGNLSGMVVLLPNGRKFEFRYPPGELRWNSYRHIQRPGR